MRDIAIRKEFKKLNTYDLSYFRGKNHFDEYDTQNWFIFQPMGRYLEVAYTNSISYVLSWKSKGLTDLGINSIKRSNYLLNPYINTCDNNKIRVKFNGRFLNRFPPSILYGNIVNIYIVYEITDYFNDNNYPTIENCLFGSVKLTKNADLNKNSIPDMVFGLIEKYFFLILLEEQAEM